MSDAFQQARTLFLEGTAHFEAGRLEAAADRFEAARALAPQRPSVLANLGVALFRLGRFQEAVGHLEAAMAAEPAHLDAWMALGLSHEALGQLPQALGALEQAQRHGAQSGPAAGAAWLAIGRCRGRLGDEPAALACFDQALVHDATLAEAWSARGDLLRHAGRLDEAADCFRRALALGADTALNRFYLASVQPGASPPQAPLAYVETLFDQYAGDFETHLLDGLQYRGHEMLLQPVLAGLGECRLALDLGCGTGLCGRLLHPRCRAVDGVDVSLAMVEQARASGAYRRVEHADLLAFLDASDEPADLVVAADVFIYVGALDAVFAAVRRRLTNAGVFAFSVENHAGPDDLQLLSSLRYAHAPAYLHRLAEAHGFRVRSQWQAPLRQEQGRTIDALYLVLETGT